MQHILSAELGKVYRPRLLRLGDGAAGDQRAKGSPNSAGSRRLVTP